MTDSGFPLGTAIVVMVSALAVLMLLTYRRSPTHWIRQWADENRLEVVRLECEHPARYWIRDTVPWGPPQSYRAKLRDQTGATLGATITCRSMVWYIKPAVSVHWDS
jgi:hypothetical protein